MPLHSLLHTLVSIQNTKKISHRFKSHTHQTLHNLLEKCSSMAELKILHAQVIIHGLKNENLTMGKIVSYCAVADCGNIYYAQLVFDQVCEPNKYMYNSLIRGYSNCDDSLKPILLYRQMICAGFSPNEFTLPFVFKACASRMAYWQAILVHAQAIKFGMGSLVIVQNALMNAYAVCQSICSAQKVFDDISDKTLVSWNILIGGYSKMGLCAEAFFLFQEMRELGLDPDKFTIVNLLSASSRSCNLISGRFVHHYIVVTGTSLDLIVNNAIVDMYAKCGDLQSARAIFDGILDKNAVSWTSIIYAYAKQGFIKPALELFHEMPVKNVVSWNAIISCHVQEGHYKEAVNLFNVMRCSEIMPDEATLVSILSACIHIGDFELGMKIHKDSCSNNMTLSVTLCNSIIDMYAKCGALGTALDIFSGMQEKNLVSWNTAIGALALHGFGEEAVETFKEMQLLGYWPDEITFTGLLSACNHSGLVEMGLSYFKMMTSNFKIYAQVEHYACVIDLLGRGGHFQEAVRLITEMPIKPDVVIWGALLGACRTHRNLEMAQQIVKQLLEIQPYSSGLYVLLSNIYSENGKWEDVKKIRKLMGDRELKKIKAISFIEIEGSVHEFMVDDKSREDSSSTYMTVNQLTDHLKSSRYVCNLLNLQSDEETI